MFHKSAPIASMALLLGMVLLVGFGWTPSNRVRREISKGQAATSLAALPRYFEPAPGGGFIARAKGCSVHLGSEGARFAFHTGMDTVGKASDVGKKSLPMGMRPSGGRRRPISGEKRLRAKKHYLTGADPRRWRRDVPLYERVRSRGVYPGVDLVYYFDKDSNLEYDFEVAAGIDPSVVKLEFTGVPDARLSETGDLLLTSPSGELRHLRPVVYQLSGGARQAVEATYRVAQGADQATVSFRLGAHDRSRPLVIDPKLTFSTFLGGDDPDVIRGVALATDGTVYVTGATQSPDFPLVAPLQTIQANQDAILTHLDLSRVGSAALLSSTIIGGSSTDQGLDLVVDSTGAPCITGSTFSTDFPTSTQAFQTDQPSEDAFVMRLTPECDALLYSTYLGGSETESAAGIAVDTGGKLYVCGDTDSADFPTRSPAQTDRPERDAFVAKLDPSLQGANSLLYSTYLGGSDSDFPSAIAVDANGFAHVVGTTESPDFPVTAGAFVTTPQGFADMFVCRLNGTGNALTYSTFLGGFGNDFGGAVFVKANGDIAVGGTTGASNYPLTPSAIDSTAIGLEGAFTLLRPSATGSAQLLYSTFLGGNGNDTLIDFKLNSAGNAFITGSTKSTNFPLVRAFQTVQDDGEVYVARLDPSKSGVNGLLYSSLLGGNGDDRADACALSPAGEFFVGGSTPSSSFPVSTGAPQTVFGGQEDGFLARITLAIPNAPTTLKATTGSATQIKLTWQDKAIDEASFQVERKVGTGNFQQIATLSQNSTTFVDRDLPANTFTYRVRAVNADGASAFSNQATAATLPPTAPGKLTATTLGPTVKLTWTDSTNESGYEIHRNLSGSVSFTIVGTLGAGATTFSEVTAGNQTFIYVVKAVSPVATVSSNQVTATTLAAPTNLVVNNRTGSATQLGLVWTDNSLNLETGFVIQRKVAGGSFNDVRQVGANVASVQDTGLSPDTEYFYRVQARNSTGRSVISNQASNKTARIPVAPSNVTAKALSGTQVRIRWQDNSLFEIGFRVERAKEGQDFAAVGTVGKNGADFLDGALKPRTVYIYQVFAFNDGGDSPPSNEADVRTPRGPEGRLAVADKVRFPDTKTGESSLVVLMIRNRSPHESLLVLIEPPTGPFSASGELKRRLKPSSATPLSLRFLAPHTVGETRGELVLRSSDPKHPEVRVRLSGTTTGP